MAVQFTSMTAVINPAGWSVWDSTDPTDNVSFGEYNNTGPGASGTRVSFATQLSEPLSIASVLGSDYASQSWVDTSYL